MSAYPAVAGLIAVCVLSNLAERGLEAVWAFYTSYRYGWSPAEVGLSLAAVGALFAIVQGGLVRIIVPRLGEWRTLVIGLAVAGLSFVLYAFAARGWMIYAVMVIHLVGWGAAGPVIQSLASKAVPADQQGLVQGVLMSLATVTGVVGAPLAALLFAFFISPEAPVHFPGAPFIAGALLLGASLLFVRGRQAERVPVAPAVESA